MREIKFRGKRIDNGEWIYGYLFQVREDAYILWGTTNGIPNMIKVDSKTVGQFTGLKDKNGKEIYKGDWIKGKCREGLVVFKKGSFHCYDEILCESLEEDNCEIIGNIHENKDLITT